MLVRTQMDFPATGEVLAPYALAHYVGGGMRGSHQMPLMPVPLTPGTSYFDGPPLITCAAFCVHEGKLTERPVRSAISAHDGFLPHMGGRDRWGSSRL